MGLCRRVHLSPSRRAEVGGGDSASLTPLPVLWQQLC